jgi:hypothetical protein
MRLVIYRRLQQRLLRSEAFEQLLCFTIEKSEDKPAAEPAAPT